MSTDPTAVKSCCLILLGMFSVHCGRQPSNYDDCILQYVKAGMDSAAVVAVRNSCRAKFPVSSIRAEQSGDRNLSESELQLLTGRAGLSYGNRYSGNLYNGNEQVVVTRVEFLVITTVSKERVERTYWTDLTIGPKKTESFGFDIIVGDQGAEYAWRISQAWGRPPQ